MTSPATLHLLTLLSLIAAISAQNLAGPQYVTCSCSPSTRGYRLTVLDDLQNDVRQLHDDVIEWKNDGLPQAEIASRTSEQATLLWNNCIGNHSPEECVNADAALRIGRCKPNCASMCFFDKRTWQNIAADRVTPRCDAAPRFASTDPDLLAGPSPGTDVRRSAVNPYATSTVRTPPPKTGSSNTVNRTPRPSALLDHGAGERGHFGRGNSMLIFKIFYQSEWDALRTAGATKGSPLDVADGFIHMSTAEQVKGTVSSFFSGATDLVLVAIESGPLGDDLKWEAAGDRGGAMFPHLYRELRMTDVAWDKPIPLTCGHVFPDEIK